MSFYISKTDALVAEPILKTISKQIVVPNLKRLSDGVNHCDEKEKRLLKVMFFQLKNQEYESLHRQNAIEMQKQFKLLKSKMRNQLKFQKIQRSQQYHRSLPKLQLSDILKMSPEKIDLLKKYRNRIYGKLSLFKEMQQINKQKQNLNRWQDQTRNCPLKSPMFSKMTYLLQKLNKLQKQGNLASKYPRVMRKTTNGCVQKIKKGS